MGSGTFKRFEEIKAWQVSRRLINAIYTITRNDSFRRDVSLKDQIRRAAISTMLNIAEGFAHNTDREFRRFLSHAHGSAAEVQSALYIALDQQYISKAEFDTLYACAEELSKMISGLSKYLAGRSYDSRLSTQDSETSS